MIFLIRLFLTKLAYLDLELSALLYSSKEGWTRKLLKFLEHSGDGTYWIPLAAVAWAVPSLVDPAYHACLANLMLGFILDLIIIGTLKGLVRRRRPAYNKADMMLVVGVDKFSFPSGHSSRCLFIAVTAAGCLPAQRRLPVCAWALGTALSRVVLGRHYLGDVVAGMAIGTLLGAFVAARGRDIIHQLQLQVAPMLST